MSRALPRDAVARVSGGVTRARARVRGRSTRPRARVDAWEAVQLPLSDARAREFMETYWQKKPLLMRGAIPGFIPPLDANDIAGLACEEDASARLFTREGEGADAWRKRIGPFEESDLTSLASDGAWSLIVNDLDSQAEPFGAMLSELFDCFPRWRISDISGEHFSGRRGGRAALRSLRRVSSSGGG